MPLARYAAVADVRESPHIDAVLDCRRYIAVVRELAGELLGQGHESKPVAFTPKLQKKVCRSARGCGRRASRNLKQCVVWRLVVAG